MVGEFADCVRLGKKPEVGGEEGMRSLAVILAANQSAKSGKSVEIAEILAR
jgi:predicted dehydrogenase